MHQAEHAFLILHQETIVDANPAAARLLGVALTQLTGNTLVRFCPELQPDGRSSQLAWQACLQNCAQSATQSDGSLSFDWVFQGQPQQPHQPLHAAVRLSQFLQYTLLSFRELDSDLLKSRQIEAELVAKRLEFQTLLDNFPGGVTMVDASLRFVAWNKESLRLTGFTEELFRPEAPPNLFDLWRINIERNEYGPIPAGVAVEDMLEEWRLRFHRREPHLFERIRPNGTVLEIRGVPMENGGFVSTYQDVTVRHQLREQLRTQSLLLQEVLEHMAAGITVFDEHLRLKVWNSGVADMLGLPPQLFVSGVPYEDLLRTMLAAGEYGEYGEVDIETELARRMQVVRRFHEHRYERTMRNGRTFLIHGKPLKSGDKVVEFITTLTEITDRKQSENALHQANARLEKLVSELSEARFELVRTEKLAALGALVAGVAHELNTPLGNCLLMTSAIHDATVAASAKMRERSIARKEITAWLSNTVGAVDLLAKNLSSAAELVTRFKDVAISHGNSQRGRFDLGKFMLDVAVLEKEKISHAGHRLLLDVEPDLVFDSYPGPLEQVMVTLINNSLLHGFGSKPGGTMRMVAKRCAKPDAPTRVVITFADDGVGIDAHALGRIFDPFFTTRMGQGCTGLGLHICYNIVTGLLGGEISASSTPGQGATLRLILPLQAPLNQ
jgi:signal transduction histidine kinase/PAS domain-containing protein